MTDTYRTVTAHVTLANGAVHSVYAGAVTPEDDLANMKRRARPVAVEEAAHRAGTTVVGAKVSWEVEGVSDPELDRLLAQVVSPDARLLAALDAATTVDPNGYELEALRDEDGTPSGAWAVRVTIDRPGARRPVAISMVGHPLLDAVIVIVGRARVISSIPAPSSSDLVAVLV